MVALCAAASCKQFKTVSNDPLDTQIYTLDNGLQVYMTVNKEQPRIQTYIAVKVGSKNDPSETTGLAHYFEHLMFKGTEQFGTSDYEAEKPMLDEIEQLFEVYRQTTDEAERQAIYHQIDSISYEASKIAIPNEYDKLMAMIGADGTNAWTSTDETVYTEDIPSNQIDNWARIQADRFRNNVIRGFHTELETIYEEKNMSLTQDSRKVWEALDAALFPHHPYGQQTTLGTQEHLKNPSITNVKKYHDTYYVPNNIRICLSGDFNPKEMVKVIEKYFGDWEPNNDLPKLQFEPEPPITEPVVKDVYGLESENLAMGWRLPGTNDLEVSSVAQIAGSILSNGMAGLIDLDVVQQQKALSLYAGFSGSPDYSQFIVMGRPKNGQTLEEVRDLALEEIAKLRSGDFDESLIASSINNVKLSLMQQLEYNESRAQMYVDAFIAGIDWQDYVNQVDMMAAVTKDDVVAFANEYLQDNACAIIFKRMGEDTTVQKISAPKITPIVTNRDKQSAFLQEIQGVAVKPIEPVFVDFSKDMSVSKIADGAELLYKHNDINDIFSVDFVFNTGTDDNPALALAGNYISYLGTPEMSAEEFASKMYAIACDFSFRAGATQSTLSVSGLSEYMPEAIKLVETLIAGAEPDEDILAALKMDMIQNRANTKLNQRSCYSALTRYIEYGPEYIQKITLDNGQLSALSSEDILSAARQLLTNGHEICYYGPKSEADVIKDIKESHSIAEGAEILPERYAEMIPTPSSKVVMAQYDSKQIYYLQYSNRGEKFNPEAEAVLDMYNEYFGGGMNTVVFQEMREARGLAYSAWARLYAPSHADDTYCYNAFIATQNDKMQTAVEAFDEIINNMPQSDAAFKVAKDALEGRLRTQRYTGANVLRSYLACRRLGLSEPMDKKVFEALQGITMEDVVAAQQEWVKDRDYTYAILGDIKDLDVDFLKTLGPVEIVTLEDIFGY